MTPFLHKWHRSIQSWLDFTVFCGISTQLIAEAARDMAAALTAELGGSGVAAVVESERNALGSLGTRLSVRPPAQRSY